MLKNAFLSIKKNIGKTVLLFVIMTVIANLIIAGLSIQSASKKSMEQIRTSLGNDVTLTTNMQNMMGQREKGQAVSEVAASVTIAMADQLKDLKYVKNYNYAISTTASSDDITAVELTTFTVYTTINEETVTQQLTIVGIYEVTDAKTMGGPGQSNPFNTIYTDLSIGQTLSGSETNITSATYYLDDPENIEAFQTLAQKKSDIDFETYTLDANDRLYQQNVSSLENTQSFATMFLIVVIGAGSAILCLILILTIRSRYYEIGVFLSLGQSKVKIILQQLFEMLLIAAVAFVISLGTGKLVSNVVGNMLESGTNNNQVQMQMPEIRDQNNDSNNTNSTSGNDKMFDQAFNGPENTELDVSLTTTTVMQLAGITIAICLVSIAIPSAYVLRLSPREILVKKEG